MKIRIEPIELMLQGAPYMLNRDLYRECKTANLSPKYYASRATFWSYLQYLSGGYPAGMADLFSMVPIFFSSQHKD